MLPLHDDIPPRSFPFVNYVMIGLCTLVFIAQQAIPTGEPTLSERFGMIPARVENPDQAIMIQALDEVETDRGLQQVIIKREAAPSPVPAIATMLTCIFLHGGWMHFLGNMWFLHIFGDNIEDRFGHVGYTIFYLVCGISASAAHYYADTSSMVPTIGASGAIAGVMGAYLVWYPRAQVKALIPLGVIMQIMVVPAPLFLGVWFAMQAFNVVSGPAAGVAWWAHIGGFIVGAVLALVLGKTPLTSPANPVRDNGPRRTYRYRRG